MVGVDLSGANLDGAQMGGTVVDTSALAQARHLSEAARAQLAEPTLQKLSAEALAAAVAQHERWVESGGAAGARLDLDMAELPPADLSGRVLAGARLRRCRAAGLRLHAARLDMADLAYTDLRGADLERASLRGATLRRAVLERAQLAGAVLEAQPMSGGRDWPANLEGAVLRGADLTNAVLLGAILRRADLVGAITTGLSLKGADLTGARRTAEGETMEAQRRRLRRFTQPVLVVGSRKGTARTRDWSFGGLALAVSTDGYAMGEKVTLLVACPAVGEPVPVQAVVTALNPAIPSVSLRFEPLTDELKALLNQVVPEHLRMR